MKDCCFNEERLFSLLKDFSYQFRKTGFLLK